MVGNWVKKMMLYDVVIVGINVVGRGRMRGERGGDTFMRLYW